MAASPTQRTLGWLRTRGWPLVQKVEYWNAHAKKSIDLFGFCDVLAIHPGRGVLYVQATSYSNANARLNKMRDKTLGACEMALFCGGKIEIHGWKKYKTAAGHGQKLWFPRVIDVNMLTLHNVTDDQMDKCLDIIAGAMPAHDRFYDDTPLPSEDWSLEWDYKASPPRMDVTASKHGVNLYQNPPGKKEKEAVSKAVAYFTRHATESYSCLSLQEWPTEYSGAFGIGYAVKPKRYRSLLEEAEIL
jgi:hypothetical protein